MSSHRKAEKICLSEHAPGGCEKSKNVQYTIGIDVPSVPPTDLTSSSVCRVKYELQVSISIHTKFDNGIKANVTCIDNEARNFICKHILLHLMIDNS